MGPRPGGTAIPSAMLTTPREWGKITSTRSSEVWAQAAPQAIDAFAHTIYVIEVGVGVRRIGLSVTARWHRLPGIDWGRICMGLGQRRATCRIGLVRCRAGPRSHTRRRNADSNGFAFEPRWPSCCGRPRPRYHGRQSLWRHMGRGGVVWNFPLNRPTNRWFKGAPQKRYELMRIGSRCQIIASD